MLDICAVHILTLPFHLLEMCQRVCLPELLKSQTRVKYLKSNALLKSKMCTKSSNLKKIQHLAAKMISNLSASAIINQEAATNGEQHKNAPRGPEKQYYIAMTLYYKEVLLSRQNETIARLKVPEIFFTQQPIEETPSEAANHGAQEEETCWNILKIILRLCQLRLEEKVIAYCEALSVKIEGLWA